MALPWRPRVIPRCTACLRNHALTPFTEAPWNTSLAPRQQVRGKKKMPKAIGLPVRLLQDVPTYGAKGSIVPTARGLMRSKWFCAGIAEYIAAPELRAMRRNNVAMDRDFQFMLNERRRRNKRLAKLADGEAAAEDEEAMDAEEIASASAFQKDAAARARLSPERSAQLLEIFVPPRIDFYRQPIVEESKKAEEQVAEVEGQDQRRRGMESNAAAELLAARSVQVQRQKAAAAAAAEKAKPKAIYGSVSAHEVLVAIRAVMAENDEASRVVLQDGDVQFVDLPTTEGVVDAAEKDRVKHTGDFTVEVRVKGSDAVMKRTVRVNAQEA